MIVDRALAELSPGFDDLYAANGRASIPPEWLLKGCLLIALYSIRSERQLCEQLQYNLLFKWFLNMDVETPAFDATTFTKNRDRLLSHEVAPRFFQAVLAQAKAARLISAEHFTVDGTLLEAWASLKSFQPRDAADHRPRGGGGGTRNPDVDFRGTPRRNDTHVSTTDPDARLFTKGVHQTAKLCYSGNVLMENRHGLVVDVLMAPAGGRAERETGLRMLRRQGVGRRRTVAADKGYDTSDFVSGCRALKVTPQVARNITAYRGSHIDDRSAAGLRRGAARAQARGRDLRLGEDGGRWPKTALRRARTQSAVGGVHHHRVQPGANVQVDGGSGVRLGQTPTRRAPGELGGPKERLLPVGNCRRRTHTSRARSLRAAFQHPASAFDARAFQCGAGICSVTPSRERWQLAERSPRPRGSLRRLHPGRQG